MAENPEGAVALSDDDIDSLVDEVEGKTGSPAADTVEASETADTGVESQDEASPTGELEVEVRKEGIDEEAETPPPEGAAPPPVTGPVTEKPFQYRAARETFSFPGATELSDGTVKVTKEGVGQLREVLGSYVGIQKEWKTQRRDLERQLRTVQEDRSAKDVEADQVIGLFTELRGMTPEQRWDWANEFDAKAPKLELAIERAKIDRERKEVERLRNGPELSEEEARERETLEMELPADPEDSKRVHQARSSVA